MILRIFLLISLTVMFLGCKEKPPATPLDNDPSGPSIYDNNNAYDGGALESGGTIEDDGLNVDYDDPDIESSRLDLMDSGARDLPNLDLDWGPVFFLFDDATLTDEARSRLNEYARMLKDNNNLHVLLEGHCDTRGTEDYNVALGERRAQAVKLYLVNLGVPASRLKTISYGEMRPIMSGENEASWARNRRVAFTF